MRKQPCMVTPANTPNRDTQYLKNNHLFQIEPRMDADKVSFLAGNELPEAALVRTLLVANPMNIWSSHLSYRIKNYCSSGL